MSARLPTLLGSFAALFVLGTAGHAEAFCRMTTESEAQVGDAACIEEGIPLQWNNTCLSYAIDERGSEWMDLDDIASAVTASFQAWATADCDGAPPNLVFQRIQNSRCKRPEFNTTGNVNTIAFLDPWEDPCRTPDELPYPPRAFAVTVVFFNTSSGEILDADMLINDQLAGSGSAGGPYANCPDTGCEAGNPGEADLANIVTHEAGHFIGIGHCNPENPRDPNDPCVVATMYAQADRSSVNKRTLAADDIDAVCTIYPPGNLDASCDPTPMGGLQLNCETNAQGEPLACDGPGSTSSGGGCSASGTSGPAEAPWGLALATLLGLIWLRRRSPGSAARS